MADENCGCGACMVRRAIDFALDEAEKYREEHEGFDSDMQLAVNLLVRAGAELAGLTNADPVQLGAAVLEYYKDGVELRGEIEGVGQTRH